MPVVGGNIFVVVEAEGDDLVHSDGRTAQKAGELLEKYKDMDKPFFLGVGFVRPHVPFVAPKSYYEPFDYDKMVLPEKVKGDWDDIPKMGINYKTSLNMKMVLRKQRKAVGGYYASVAYMDAMVGKVLNKLKETGFLYRDDKWAYMQYRKGAQLYDMKKDPLQYNNLISNPEYKSIVETYKKKLAETRKNDLGLRY